SLTYTPNANFNGTDTFTYSIVDVDGDTDTATVTVTVNSVDDGPGAVDDLYVIDEDTPLIVPAETGVLNNDTLGGDGGVLVVASNTPPSNGILSINPDGNSSLPRRVIRQAVTELTINVDGSFSYIPNPDFNGTDTFTYTITDADGTSNTATVVIVVNSVNDAPKANDDVFTINEDDTLSLPKESGVLSNDSAGGDGGPLEIVDHTQPENGTVILTPDGVIIYIPDPNFNGLEIIEYTVQDGDGTTDTATITIVVNDVNDAPTVDNGLVPGEFDAENGFTWKIDDGETVNRDIGGAFSDVDGDPLQFVAEGLPSGLTLDPESGVLSGTIDNSASRGGDNNDGVYVVVITVSDQNGGSVELVITIVVDNPVPLANQDIYFVDEDSALNVSAPGVLENDTDPDGDALQVVTIFARERRGESGWKPDLHPEPELPRQRPFVVSNSGC
ncbi:MAG: Ig-like domain-containing protein, partial [Verrucomicrobia bacterium]|nr:Ig-like domain-containing protein [Verrucomicrobiota bacterium]